MVKKAYILLCCVILLLFVSCKSKKEGMNQSNYFFTVKDFPLVVQNKIDSFLVSESERDFGVFSVFISRKNSGCSIRINHSDVTSHVEELSSGYPFAFEKLNDKLLLYYSGTELFQKPQYNISELSTLYKEQYKKYKTDKYKNALLHNPYLSIDVDEMLNSSQLMNDNYYYWFFNVEQKEFIPPVLNREPGN